LISKQCAVAPENDRIPAEYRRRRIRPDHHVRRRLLRLHRCRQRALAFFRCEVCSEACA
jgi:hypothetical protein